MGLQRDVEEAMDVGVEDATRFFGLPISAVLDTLKPHAEHAVMAHYPLSLNDTTVVLTILAKGFYAGYYHAKKEFSPK